MKSFPMFEEYKLFLKLFLSELNVFNSTRSILFSSLLSYELSLILASYCSRITYLITDLSKSRSRESLCKLLNLSIQ